MQFADRTDAGRRLAQALRDVAADQSGGDAAGDRPGAVVLGLPRGGVPVAAEVAAALNLPLDVIVVRKLGVPWQPELAMGAVGEDGVRVVDENTIWALGLSPEAVAEVEARERDQVERRVRMFRQGRPAVPLAGRTVIVVDDGIATGATMRAACRVVRARGARQVVAATPVASTTAAARLIGDADEVIALQTPSRFQGVGQWYLDFSPTSDEEVIWLLAPARHLPPVQ